MWGAHSPKIAFPTSLRGYSGSVGPLNSTVNLIPCEAGITGSTWDIGNGREKATGEMQKRTRSLVY